MTLHSPLDVGISLQSWQAALGALGLDPASFPQDVAGGFPRAEVTPGAWGAGHCGSESRVP